MYVYVRPVRNEGYSAHYGKIEILTSGNKINCAALYLQYRMCSTSNTTGSLSNDTKDAMYAKYANENSRAPKPRAHIMIFKN